MLEQVKEALNERRVVFASSSPRKIELLRSTGLKFEVFPPLLDTSLKPEDFDSHADYAIERAYEKVASVETYFQDNSPDIIIGADTVVSLDGEILESPSTFKTAEHHLEKLRGRYHTVYTGVVIKMDKILIKFHESCQVYMTLSYPSVIRAYLKTRESLGKPGGYSIDGLGASLIEKVKGDVSVLHGLPLHSLCKNIVWLMDHRIQNMRLKKKLGHEGMLTLLQDLRARDESESQRHGSRSQASVIFPDNMPPYEHQVLETQTEPIPEDVRRRELQRITDREKYRCRACGTRESTSAFSTSVRATFKGRSRSPSNAK